MQQLRDILRRAERQRSRRPSAQPARRQEPRRPEAWISRPGVPLTSRSGNVLKYKDMVYDPGIPRTNVERPHPPVARHPGRNREALVEVATLRRDLELRS